MIISRFGEQYLLHNIFLYNPFLIIHLAPAFVFGAVIYKTFVVSKLQNKIKDSGHKALCVTGAIIALLSIVFIVCVVRKAVFGPTYAAAFIILFLLIPRPRIVDIVLAHFGKHSMNMWLIHSWYCYYLFREELYSLRYPILIYVTLAVVSLLSSYVINGIVKLLRKSGSLLLSLRSQTSV